MAETNNPEEPALPLPAKRKPDLTSEDSVAHPNKNPKLQASLNEIQNPECVDSNSLAAQVEADKVAAGGQNGEGDSEAEVDDNDDDDDEDNQDGEESNGKAETDRKGKGITRDDKGKGKLIAEEDDDGEEDSDDDSGDGGSELEDGDSDLSDDPLAEVDLDNILPSRTRRRQVQPGVYIANDHGNDKDDDDSDDSDA
ncbi:hypothetical protein FNV43_RR22391 [Rhamnella rubrinervis]|uniref:Histone chaperone domain-containing protein n=1 Tax=Rhamnella rubrinervis TaxID=2594499 RepID=A0A8K0DWH7_9ROSA|nr:hypothetical protein FNV43_RR22391 [Rhamnella rubrinervis]